MQDRVAAPPMPVALGTGQGTSDQRSLILPDGVEVSVKKFARGAVGCVVAVHAGAWAVAAQGAMTPVSAAYSVHADVSAHDLFEGINDSRGGSGGESQPPSPFAAFVSSETFLAHLGNPQQPPTGRAGHGLDAGAPLTGGWTAEGLAWADVTGNQFSGLLGKGRAWSEATLVFSVPAPTEFLLEGWVRGRADGLVDPTWVNFEEVGLVELWQGATLLHRAAGGVPGAQEPFSFGGILAPGEYRIEARARARTESLAFNQPWQPSSGFSVDFVVPAPGAAVAIVGLPIMAMRRRRRA